MKTLGEKQSIAVGHYDDSYFEWQNKNAELGSRLNVKKFRPFLKPEHRSVLDFGCGGGWLLTRIEAERKIGIEINPIAQSHAKARGIEVYNSITDIQSDTVDAVISHHALEHVENPLGILKEMMRVVRRTGIVIVVIPCDRANVEFRENDKDFHLFSWSAGNIGNLATAAGLSVVNVGEIVHRWPPKWTTVYRALGPVPFDLLCQVYGFLRRDRTQVRLVASK